MRHSFNGCVFDSGTREVVRGDRSATLPPKAFLLLDLLIASRPNTVSKEEIHKRLWPDTFVVDANLANLVADLREALGDDARRPSIIRTVHRFGYAFRGKVEEVPVDSKAPSPGRVICRVLWDGREISLRDGENILGREFEAAVWIDESSVSRHHARIVVDGEGAMLEDLGSKNGTKLQGRKISRREQLADRDVIEIGPASIVFRVYRQASSTTTAAEDDPA
jgi:DNA-binding winged helix-turn-helix (wHTH) protein